MRKTFSSPDLLKLLSNSPSQAKSLLALFHILENLKTTKRTGWIACKIPQSESISDHMYRMSLISFCLNDIGDIDRTKCIMMCLVHDIGEALGKYAVFIHD